MDLLLLLIMIIFGIIMFYVMIYLIYKICMFWHKSFLNETKKIGEYINKINADYNTILCCGCEMDSNDGNVIPSPNCKVHGENGVNK